MEVTYIATLLAFAILLVLCGGIAFYVRYLWRISQRPRAGGYRMILGGLLAAGCLPLAAFFMFCPSLAERREIVNRIVGLPRAEVTSVLIAPYPGPGYPSLVGAPVAVTASADLDRIVDALHGSRVVSPNHPRTVWSALVRITASTGNRSFIVISTNSVRNGTLIQLDSNLTYGWHIADLRCDDLGSVLQGLAGNNPEVNR